MKSWLRWRQWNVAIHLNQERIPASCFSLHFHMSLFLVLETLCIHSALQIVSFLGLSLGRICTSVCPKHLSHLTGFWLITYICKFILEHCCGKGRNVCGKGEHLKGNYNLTQVQWETNMAYCLSWSLCF